VIYKSVSPIFSTGIIKGSIYVSFFGLRLEVKKLTVVLTSFFNFITTMKQNYYSLLLCLSLMLNGLAQTTTFTFTGSVQNYTVPPGVTTIQIESFGAQGGGTYGGNGGRAIGTFSVTPGTVYQVYVGGKPSAQLGPGGFNGGGAVLILPCGGGDGWPGGGASDVRTTAALANRIIVAGGGGGQGWSNGIGGSGGGTTAGDGAASWITGTNGKGGTASAGGAGGFYSGNGGTAPSGTFGVGGNSSPLDTYCTGGAGGGGWYGGGGGYVSAGGGGSSYISFPGTTNASTTAGLQSGNGTVIITVICSALNPVVSATTVCNGDPITLSASSGNGGTITWDNGVANGVPFIPASSGNLTYTASSSNANDCAFTANILVNNLPTIDAGTDVEICDGETVTLTATGTGTFTWDNGINQGISFTPMAAITTYTVTADNGNCIATDDVIVTMNALPTADAGTDVEICDGETVTLTATGTGTFTWDNGIDQGIPFTPTAAITIYTVTADNGNCIATDDVMVTVNQLPTVDAGTDVEICEGETVTLTALGTGTFSWDNGIDQGIPFTPTAAITIYTVTADNGDCTATDEVTVTMNTAPISTASLSGAATLNAGPAGQSYQWMNCTTGVDISGQNLSTYTATANGSYAVIVTNSDGCSDTSLCVSVTTLDLIENSAIEGISFYPNPTTGQVLVSMEGISTGTLSVFDVQGKLVLEAFKVENGSTFDLSSVQTGVYMIHIETVKGLGISRIVKN
jgi:hypothetical protein